MYRARYTSPILPAPSGATISYGPSFVPEESPMFLLGIIALAGALIWIYTPIQLDGYSSPAEPAKTFSI